MEWIDKEVKFPILLHWSNDGVDTVNVVNTSRLKIVSCIDSTGCMACRSHLPLWNQFISEIDSITDCQVATMIFLYPHRVYDVVYMLRRDNFRYPVIVDSYDSLNTLNHFPNEEEFRTFLIDEDNRVLLIGNPVLNPKIKDLYIRTICERFSLESLSVIPDDKGMEHNFGKFPYSESMSTQFILRNYTETPVLIDSVFTSCECTIASIDKFSLEPNESVNVSVTFKADKPEQFMREIYVRIGGVTRIFRIRGEAE